MKYSLDACVIRDNRVFAYGWYFDSQSPVEKLQLCLTLADGTVARLPVTARKERPDVAQAFPAEAHAVHSGWLAYGAWEGSLPRHVSLWGRLRDGREFTCPLETSELPLAASDRSLGSALRSAVRSMRRSIARTPPAVVRSKSGDHWLEAIRSALASAHAARCPLVVDHAMGGGASGFSKQWIDDRHRTDPIVLVLTFEITALRYRLELRTRDGVERVLDFLAEPASALVQSGLVSEVLYNDAVSFPRPALVPEWLVAFRSVPGASLTIAIHDYLAICPSQFLLNDGGRFCGVPDLAECARCLPRNDNEFARLFPEARMPEWRARWAAALAAADEIVCFSSSSERLLRRAYPALPFDRIRVRPHEVKTFDVPVSIEHVQPLHIGVVGAIGWHKGAGVLQELAAEIASRSLPIRITVIGSVEAPCDQTVLRATGPFAREDLPRLIAESGANVFLLPSICPETFSYVTQELITLGVPLACFDFGAPAERVGSYRLGLVVPRSESSDLLDSLIDFHGQLADQEEGVQ
jgi:glycosyltransferase involved in cell wall biosynthesis